MGLRCDSAIQFTVAAHAVGGELCRTLLPYARAGLSGPTFFFAPYLSRPRRSLTLFDRIVRRLAVVHCSVAIVANLPRDFPHNQMHRRTAILLIISLIARFLTSDFARIDATRCKIATVQGSALFARGSGSGPRRCLVEGDSRAQTALRNVAFIDPRDEFLIA